MAAPARLCTRYLELRQERAARRRPNCTCTTLVRTGWRASVDGAAGYPRKRAKDLVLEGLASRWAGNIWKTLSRALPRKRWVDVYENQGNKRSGRVHLRQRVPRSRRTCLLNHRGATGRALSTLCSRDGPRDAQLLFQQDTAGDQGALQDFCGRSGFHLQRDSALRISAQEVRGQQTGADCAHRFAAPAFPHDGVPPDDVRRV